MENKSIKNNVSAVGIAENNIIKENKSLMQRLMATTVIAIVIAILGMTSANLMAQNWICPNIYLGVTSNGPETGRIVMGECVFEYQYCWSEHNGSYDVYIKEFTSISPDCDHSDFNKEFYQNLYHAAMADVVTTHQWERRLEIPHCDEGVAIALRFLRSLCMSEWFEERWECGNIVRKRIPCKIYEGGQSSLCVQTIQYCWEYAIDPVTGKVDKGTQILHSTKSEPEIHGTKPDCPVSMAIPPGWPNFVNCIYWECED